MVCCSIGEGGFFFCLVERLFGSPPFGTWGGGDFSSAGSFASLIFRFAQDFCYTRHNSSKLGSALVYRKKSHSGYV